MKTIDEAVSSEQIRAEVKFEYDTLKSIARVVSNSGERRLCALNPVGYLDDLNALVTEEIHLSMLKDRLARIPVMLGAKTAWEDFSDKLQLAGKWLKFIHAAFSRNEEVTLTELGIFERALEEIAILEKKQIPSLCFLRIKFEDLYSLLSHEKIPMSSKSRSCSLRARFDEALIEYVETISPFSFQRCHYTLHVVILYRNVASSNRKIHSFIMTSTKSLTAPVSARIHGRAKIKSPDLGAS